MPPAEMSTLRGENDKPGVVTLADAGKPPVTAIVMKFDAFALPIVAEAVIFALPAETPVTSPVVAPTVATPVAFELHVTVAPPMAAPNWSFGAAAS